MDVQEEAEKSADFGRMQKRIWSQARYLAEKYGLASPIHVILLALDYYQMSLETKESKIRAQA